MVWIPYAALADHFLVCAGCFNSLRIFLLCNNHSDKLDLDASSVCALVSCRAPFGLQDLSLVRQVPFAVALRFFSCGIIRMTHGANVRGHVSIDVVYLSEG